MARADVGPARAGPATAPAPRDEEPLETLLARTGAGDTDAFARLYDRTAPRLYALACRVLRDRSQAEEVIQEVYLHVWRRGDSFDPAKGSAIGWMCTIAHRRAVDRVRSAQASTLRQHTWALRQLDPAHDSTAEAAHASADAHRLRHALLTLSPKQRSAIHLAYFLGQTRREVAETLGIPQSTAKTRIRDGLLALSRSLAPESSPG